MKVLFVDVDNICYEGVKSGSLINSIGMLKEISEYNNVEILEIYNSKDSNTDRNNKHKKFYSTIQGIRVTNLKYDLQLIKNFVEKNKVECVMTTLFSVFLVKKDLDLLEIFQNNSKKFIINVNDVLYVKYNQLKPEEASQYGKILKNSIIISCSDFVKENVQRDLNVYSETIYPLTNIKTTKLDKEDNYITFINPIKIKGVEIFEKVAELLPNRKFLVICGWQESSKYIPKTPNVTVLPFQKNIVNVWKKTQILLALSVIPEAYCRVVTEALLNNCSVIGFDIGGLSEASCGQAYLLKPIKSMGSMVYPKLVEKDIEEKAKEISEIITNIKIDLLDHEPVIKFIENQREQRNNVYRRIFSE